jgi:hypothetical protein
MDGLSDLGRSFNISSLAAKKVIKNRCRGNIVRLEISLSFDVGLPAEFGLSERNSASIVSNSWARPSSPE